VTERFRVDQASRVILYGGIVAYPTEAVYGIGCLPHALDALDRIISIKQRDAGKGLIIVAADISQLEPLALLPNGEIGEQLRASWPGPVTWIVPARSETAPQLTGGRATLAVRVSAHPLVRRLCRRTGSALVSTSANRSGHRPARSALTVRRALGHDVDFVLAGPLGDSSRPTEIRDAASGRILRSG